MYILFYYTYSKTSQLISPCSFYSSGSYFIKWKYLQKWHDFWATKVPRLKPFRFLDKVENRNLQRQRKSFVEKNSQVTKTNKINHYIWFNSLPK